MSSHSTDSGNEKSHLLALRTALSAKVLPCSTGTWPVKSEDLLLFYGKDNNLCSSSRIDFSSASDEHLKALSDACDAASFGVNHENVLDEMYRKAGKLDAANFAAKFDPINTDLLDSLRDVLLEGHAANRFIRAELYKLNVYGPGSFFKAHKDTPRGDNMFASLVVVYPTAHQGGVLIFRHGDLEYTLDSGTATSRSTVPCIGFAAFYSDVEHEVTVVQSGYRVTLTYNLYLENAPSIKAASFTGAYETALAAAFRALLADTSYMPDGGRIGFGLRHQYPLSSQYDLERLKNLLKGSDAVLIKVCHALRLQAKLQLLYCLEDSGDRMLCDRPIKEGDFLEGDIEYELRGRGATYLKKPERPFYYDDEDDEDIIVTHVEWATDIRPANVEKTTTPLLVYGNEPSLDYAYSTLCLIVEVGKKGDRAELA